MAGILPGATSEDRSYTDFEPHSEWLREEDRDTLVVDVSGFNKEQMKVLVNTSGNIKISGERPIDGNRWMRFQKDFVVPKYCNLKGVQAKYNKDEELLYITLPKLASQQVTSQNRPAEAQQLSPATNVTSDGRNVASYMSGIMATNKRKLLVVNVAVAIMIIMGIGIYLGYKLGMYREKDSN